MTTHVVLKEQSANLLLWLVVHHGPYLYLGHTEEDLVLSRRDVREITGQRYEQTFISSAL